MDTQHSTGSWDIEEMPGGHNFIIYQKETLIQLANVGDQIDNSYGVLPGNTILANAHLMSASRDLLHALNDLIDRVNRCRKILQESSINPGYWGILDTEKAAEAINKALNK